VEMQNLTILATKSSPYIYFDARNRVLEIKGESYPENAARFYAPVFAWLEEYLASIDDDLPVELNMEIVYFNSSSSKVYMNLFELLQNAVVSGRNIVVNWRYQEENETALECGEEFKEDLHTLTFNLVKTTED
jgi:hypothetical protein